MLDVKEPVPLPSVVCEFEIVGLVEVLQQTPRAVTAHPPVAVTLPPPVAEVARIAVIDDVVTVGSVHDGNVVKLSVAP